MKQGAFTTPYYPLRSFTAVSPTNAASGDGEIPGTPGGQAGVHRAQVKLKTLARLVSKEQIGVQASTDRLKGKRPTVHWIGEIPIC
jgi:hypothetical protein